MIYIQISSDLAKLLLPVVSSLWVHVAFSPTNEDEAIIAAENEYMLSQALLRFIDNKILPTQVNKV
jgi:hypothetical protein